MLFLPIMEALNALIHKADGWSLLELLSTRLLHRASFYADDMVMFISPTAQDLQLTHSILTLFEEAPGLGCNLAKCQMAPIRCSTDQMATASNFFPCQMVEFPVKYLGILLSITKLLRSALQPLLDRVTNKLPIWQGILEEKPEAHTSLSSSRMKQAFRVELHNRLLVQICLEI
jgi:hypothetical protein